MQQAPAAPKSEAGQTQADAPRATPPTPPGEPAGQGILREKGVPPREVPLMTIQRDEPRVQVGPVTKETGVADILLGSLGLVAVAVIASLILGAVLGALLVFLKHRLGWGGPEKDADDHLSVTR